VFSINLYLGELHNEFTEEYLRRVNLLRDNGMDFDARELRHSAREAVVKRYLEAVNQAIGSNYEVSGNAIEKHLSQKFLLPMKVDGDISQQKYEKLAYALPKNFPIQPEMGELRYYPYNDLACHVIGYVAMDEAGAENSGESVKTFAVKWQTGRTGIELAKDDVLHGTFGYELWQVDTFGRERELLEFEEAKHGRSVMLSIDKNLQSVAEMALGDNIGCAIVMNVNSGEILAMANRPSYDINSLIPKISDKTYETITSQFGWMNIATQGKFPPGSVFKLISSMAFLKSGKVSQSDSVFCDGVTEIGGRKFRCKNHTPGIDVTFGDAIARSCNTFFYENVKKIGRDSLMEEAVAAGFSEKTGVELPYEGRGFVPTAAWKKARGFGSWVIGDTINLSIGQGYLLVTPLEVCCFTSSIPKNRQRTKPTIFFNGNMEIVPDDKTLGLSPEDYNFLINSMVEVVEKRTGRRAKVENLKIAGKTGTAQFFDHGEKRNLAWFTCFAPVDKPEIAVTVMVQEKSQYDSYWGGTNAAPIAKSILVAYFSEK
jgi:penicillin-binding protein 2